MKKIWKIMMTAGLLLFVSCGPITDVEPVNSSEDADATITIAVPTCTPEAEPNLSVTSVPQPTITNAVAGTVTSTPAPQPTGEPLVTEVPAVTPTPVAEPSDTSDPEEETAPTKAPEVTLTPTVTPEPADSQQVLPTPETLIDVGMLLSSGWQKTVSIDEKYIIVFPGMFRESVVAKEDKDLIVTYTCEEETGIEFRIAYLMKQTLEDVENALLSQDGTILEGSLAEKRVVLEWKAEGMVYRGTLYEEQYPQTLLGMAFGEEEWFTGVMQVVFAYPEEYREKFETAEYKYYIKQNGEE